MSTSEAQLIRAVQSHQAGRLAEAERLYRAILERRPREGLALVNLAVLCEQSGRWTEALTLLGSAVDAEPHNADLLSRLGNASMASGRVAEGVAAYRKWTQIEPRSTVAHRTLGRALLVAGQGEEAVEAFEAALRLQSANGETQRELGEALLGSGRAREAASAFERAIGLGATSAWLGLAGARLALGAPEAAHAFGKAIDSLGNDPDAVAHHASALIASGRIDEARGLLRHGDARFPGHARTIFEMARAADLGDEVEEAKALYRRVGELAPGHSVISFNLAKLLAREGRTDQARAEFRALSERPGEPLGLAAAIREALLMPVIAADDDEIVDARTRALDAIRALGSTKAKIGDAQHEIEAPGFFLAYGGRDDRELMSDLATLMTRVVPDLVWNAPAANRDRARTRVGFISAHLKEHTVGRITSGLIEHLDRTRFEVLVLRPAGSRDRYSAEIDRHSDRVVELPSDFRLARRIVADLGLDAIYYPDIGMEPFTYYLAFSRLAPVQCVGWGHADTTGIRTSTTTSRAGISSLPAPRRATPRRRSSSNGSTSTTSARPTTTFR